eukprot:678989-Amphidinium_carterae.1
MHKVFDSKKPSVVLELRKLLLCLMSNDENVVEVEHEACGCFLVVKQAWVRLGSFVSVIVVKFCCQEDGQSELTI